MRPASRLTAILAALPLISAPLSGQSFDCDGHFTQLVVPAGFCVRVFAESIGAVRQVIIHPTGQVVAALNELRRAWISDRGNSGPDGRADQVVRFGPGVQGTGVTWRDGWLYFAADIGVIRYRWPAKAEAPDIAVPKWIAEGVAGQQLRHQRTT